MPNIVDASHLAASDSRKVLIYPRRFKTSLCRTFMANATCEYGDQCAFAHGSDDLRRSSSVQTHTEPHAVSPFSYEGQHQHQKPQQIPKQIFLHPTSDASSFLPGLGKGRSASFNSSDRDAQKMPLLSRWGSFPHAKVFYDRQASPTNRSLYHTELCRTFSTIGFCPYGASCQFAHGSQQLRKKSASIQPVSRIPSRNLSRSHSNKTEESNQVSKEHHAPRRSTFIRDRRTYKTELCRQFQQSGTCDYGSQCQFAHGIEQLRAATDAIVLPSDEDTGSYSVPTAIRSISTHQVPIISHDMRAIQVSLAPAVGDGSVDDPYHSADAKKTICNPQLFKTAICRTYSQSGSCPYEHKCRFAHGLSDLRPAPRFKTVPAPSSKVTTGFHNVVQEKGALSDVRSNGTSRSLSSPQPTPFNSQ